MNFYVNQSIYIQVLKVNAVSNSSILQIGSVGALTANSNLFNTGGFTEPAPKPGKSSTLASVSPTTLQPLQATPGVPSTTLTPPKPE
ncbi:spore germination protein GerPB [Priestia koreensis]|uniref:spore germination protein GerPB n=1 Tax=Priestia koreensis TaxID=284581 RepID=UPI0006A9CF6E|nr:spore germination protein GerPB [Priestia koreensis]MCM3004807.1 spore germination protein GerPB [Priestia koreensis]UNL85606.1 spore gernimation protein [Priestia koreensis]